MNLFSNKRNPKKIQEEIILALEDIGVSEDYFETHPFMELDDDDNYYLEAEIALEQITNSNTSANPITLDLLDINSNIDDLNEFNEEPKTKSYNLLSEIEFNLLDNEDDANRNSEVFNLTINPKTTTIQINLNKK